ETMSRTGNFMRVQGTIPLATSCTSPVSVALDQDDVFIAGASCAETHEWRFGKLEGQVVGLPDNSAAQIVVGQSWAAVTMKSGSVLQLPLDQRRDLQGTSAIVSLPGDANNTPLGAAFWGNILGFNPAHSQDSFALVDANGNVFPVLGPQPAYPSNAPCWLAKGPGSIWYSGNSPGQSISIF